MRTRRSSSSAAHPAARRHRLPWTPRPPFGSATPRLRVSGRSGGAEKIQESSVHILFDIVPHYYVLGIPK